MTGEKISKSERMILMKLETSANNLTNLSLETKNLNQKTETALLQIKETQDQSAQTVQNLDKTLNGHIQDLQERQVAMNKLIQVQKKNLENTEKSIDDRITEDEKRL